MVCTLRRIRAVGVAAVWEEASSLIDAWMDAATIHDYIASRWHQFWGQKISDSRRMGPQEG